MKDSIDIIIEIMEYIFHNDVNDAHLKRYFVKIGKRFLFML